LRPQFHHIDALDEVERLGRPREPGLTRAPEARAIHMTIKSTIDGEEDVTDTIADRLRAVQEETWKQFTYNDEESFEAWDAYSQQLFVQDTEHAPKLVSSMNKRQFLDVITAPVALQKIQEVRKLRLEEQKRIDKARAKKNRLKKEKEAAEEQAKRSRPQGMTTGQRRSRGMGLFVDGANDKEDEGDERGEEEIEEDRGVEEEL
jgi:hypothetical protein